MIKAGDKTPFINSNKRGAAQFLYKNSFTIGANGIPICKIGIPMKTDGVEKKKFRNKFRRPMFTRTKGCYCENPCSNAVYGRKVHTIVSDNSRLFCMPTKESKKMFSKKYSIKFIIILIS